MSRPRFSDALLLAGAIALATSLFLTWREPDALVVFGALDRFDPADTGWERWHVLDVALLVLAAGFAAAAVLTRRDRATRGVLVLGALLAAACIVIGGVREEGPVMALVALGLGVFALAWPVRRRTL